MTYRGNGVDGRDERKVCHSVREKQLPESTAATWDHAPEATDGHDEDDEVEAHSCQRPVTSEMDFRRADAHLLYMYRALRTAGEAPVTMHSPDSGDHSALT